MTNWDMEWKRRKKVVAVIEDAYEGVPVEVGNYTERLKDEHGIIDDFRVDYVEGNMVIEAEAEMSCEAVEAFHDMERYVGEGKISCSTV
ncbi:MAG: hypothetical protein ABEJ72_03785 [Candidatus Aenigmatarchaeota archaeon]